MVVKDQDLVVLVDLTCFGRPAVLVWRTVRWQCRQGCGSFTEVAPQICRSSAQVDGSGGPAGQPFRWAVTAAPCRRWRPIWVVCGMR